MMDFLTLDGNFQPISLYENYNSLIWAERYNASGDFQLITNDIAGAMEAIPLESFVSLRDSTVPMVAEVYKIEKTKGGAHQLTITGRSFDSVLERRAAVISSDTGAGKSSWVIGSAKPSDAAYIAMREILGGDIDLANGFDDPTSPFMDSADAIPELFVTLPNDYEYVPAWSSGASYVAGDIVRNGAMSTDPLSMRHWKALTAISSGGSAPAEGASWTELKYEISPGDLYSAVRELIALNYRGIKAVRPDSSSSVTSIEIYNGADRRNTVVFDVRFDQVESPTYLLSSQGSTNTAYIYTNSSFKKVNKTTTVETGLNRRVLYVDVSDENTTDLDSRGLVELYKYNATAIFDGQVSDNVASGYNTEYFLGDIVQMVGEYGITKDVRVVEFLRSSDSTGERSYPALEEIMS